MSKPILSLIAGFSLIAMQAPSVDDGVPVVEAWFDAMNALDGSPESIDKLLSLYREDALHITGPDSHQIGTVTYEGEKGIRFLLERTSQTREQILYRIDVVTSREVSRELFHLADGPWGGKSVAVQFHTAYTRRLDGVRFSTPGAAFFRIEDGKIGRLRLYGL